MPVIGPSVHGVHQGESKSLNCVLPTLPPLTVKLSQVYKTRLTGRRGRSRSVKLGGGGRVLAIPIKPPGFSSWLAAPRNSQSEPRPVKSACMLGAFPGRIRHVPSLPASSCPVSLRSALPERA